MISEINDQRFRAYFKNAGPDAPVESVDWNQAKAFCERVQARLPASLRDKTMRLPTEAEWEYACRAGTRTRYYLGNLDADLEQAGWYGKNSGSTTHPVGQKTANTWGLFDMHGNVWEWCLDGKREYSAASQRDPEAAGSSRVVRGGSWFNLARFCRSAYRNVLDPGLLYVILGFRVVVR